MSEHQDKINETVKKLREAADLLESKKMSPEEADMALGELQSCCGTCTGISAVPPCQNACIKVSPLF
jgi:hypothetical protein